MTVFVVTPEVRGLLRRAHDGLAEAADERQLPAARYVQAHLAALRAGAAVISANSEAKARSRERPRAVWALLPLVTPELDDLAEYFADSAGKRVRAEAGLPNAATKLEADDHLRHASEFLDLVEQLLGVEVQPPLPLRMVRD